MNAEADFRVSERPKAGASRSFKTSREPFQSTSVPAHSATAIASSSLFHDGPANQNESVSATVVLDQSDLPAALPHHFPELQGFWVAVGSVEQVGDQIVRADYSNACGVAAEWCLV